MKKRLKAREMHYRRILRMPQTQHDIMICKKNANKKDRNEISKGIKRKSGMENLTLTGRIHSKKDTGK